MISAPRLKPNVHRPPTTAGGSQRCWTCSDNRSFGSRPGARGGVARVSGCGVSELGRDELGVISHHDAASLERPGPAREPHLEVFWPDVRNLFSSFFRYTPVAALSPASRRTLTMLLPTSASGHSWSSAPRSASARWPAERSPTPSTM